MERHGLKDIWNAYMATDAKWDIMDIPFCPTTTSTIPSTIITWSEAVTIYRKEIKAKHVDFKNNAFVCFYIDDYKFDGPRGIWHDSGKALRILKHFSGLITPDFSTYQDFPIPLKIYATYRMRLFGLWAGKMGLNVINNVRWGTKDTYNYCFAGLPKNSMLAIGTNGGNPYRLTDRNRFNEGLMYMVDILTPHTLLVYGSSNYPCFEELKKRGIKIVTFKSSTALAYEKRRLKYE